MKQPTSLILRPGIILFLALVTGTNSKALADEVDLDLFSGKQWAFYPGYEFPGAKGNRRVETVDGKKALIISYDFTKGGQYVMAGMPVEIPQGSKSIHFEIKADKELKIMIRL